ncbi:MAG: glutamate synthase, partial [Clostridia bacterium]|nr:glutamate synthase [Clostridia bacterium]
MVSAAQQGLCPVDTVLSYIGVCNSQSCGKCTPCRVGLKKLRELYEKILSGEGTPDDIDLIEKTAGVIADSADCAVG